MTRCRLHVSIIEIFHTCKFFFLWNTILFALTFLSLMSTLFPHRTMGMFSHTRTRSRCQFGTFLYVTRDVTSNIIMAHCPWNKVHQSNCEIILTCNKLLCYVKVVKFIWVSLLRVCKQTVQHCNIHIPFNVRRDTLGSWPVFRYACGTYSLCGLCDSWTTLDVSVQ